MLKLFCYTDGSCYHKTKMGGIGIYITDGRKDWFFKKGFVNTTISRMEGIALLEAIRFTPKKQKIRMQVYSDSEYVVKSFTEGRLKRWVQFGFEGVKNEDMWKSIWREIQNRPNLDIIVEHIKGHQKDIENKHILGNSIADNLSNYKNHKIYHLDITLN